MVKIDSRGFRIDTIISSAQKQMREEEDLALEYEMEHKSDKSVEKSRREVRDSYSTIGM